MEKVLIVRKIGIGFGFITVAALILLCPLAKAQLKSQSKPVEVLYTSADLRDPFLSPFEKGESRAIQGAGPATVPVLSNLKVQGMVWGSQMPQAIINNMVLSVGDVIEGAEIIDVRKDGVYLLFEGRQYIIRPHISKK